MAPEIEPAVARISRRCNARRLFPRGPMNYQAFTNDSLTMMYEGIRCALAADDALKRQGQETRFRVRETPDWKKHAAELEAEMIKRGMTFEVIDRSGDHATLPLPTALASPCAGRGSTRPKVAPATLSGLQEGHKVGLRAGLRCGWGMVRSHNHGSIRRGRMEILFWMMISLAALYAFLRLAGYLLFVRKPRAR